TYVFTASLGADDDYQHGYRLKSIGGQIPMVLPRTSECSDTGVDAGEFRLCFSCHDSTAFVDSGSVATNFRTTNANAHFYHLAIKTVCGPGPKFTSDWDFSHGYDSQPSCVTCHNVHGSTQLSMVRDGSLIGREPGIQVAYYNSGVSTPCPGSPSPIDVTLDESTGVVWNASVGNACGGCHGSCGFNSVYMRDPFDIEPPTMAGVYGKEGSNLVAVKFSEGVYSNSDGSGDLLTTDFSLVDADNGRTISSLAHSAGDAHAQLVLDSPLDGVDDLGSDTLSAATAASIYDLSGNPVALAGVTIQEDLGLPNLNNRSPASGATGILIDDEISFTLADTAAGVDWNTLTVELSGSSGYAQLYSAADTGVLSRSGTAACLAVTVAPDVLFSYGEMITVTVNVSDLVGNAMTEVSWSFTTQGGGPFTTALHPSGVVVGSDGSFVVTSDWATDLDANDGDTTAVSRCCGPAGISFYVDMDDPVGLDDASIQSIRLHVYARYTVSASDSTPYADEVNIGFKTGTATIWNGDVTTDTTGDYNLISSAVYTTDSDGGALEVDDIYNLQVAVQRNNDGTAPELLVTEVYAEITYGVVEGDGSPPTIADISPAVDSTDVLIDSDISFTLADSGGGVDWSTFSMQLSGDKGYAASYSSASSQVTTSGNMASYAVTVNPDDNFSGEEVITATVNVSDRAGNPLPETIWSFTTAASSTPLTMTLTPSGKNAASSTAYVVVGAWETALDTNDGDTSYTQICCTAANSKLYMEMDDPAGLETATIQSIRFHAYARGILGTGPHPEYGSSVPVQIGFKTGTNTIWSSSSSTTHTGADTAYDLISSGTYTTDSDGGTLDLTDLNNMQLVVNWTSGRLRVTQLYLEVTYLP
ncbi:MAG: Ig-like domain-containing protein, partial [Desulfuromonadaceae bacterium]